MNTLAKQIEPIASQVVQADAASIMQVISKAASDPNTDVNKLERLMAMYERMTDRQAEGFFNDALKLAQEEMPRVLKDKENDHTQSKYTTLEALNKAVVPIITKHGFSLSFGTADSPLEKHYRVTCRVSHSGGYSRDYHADVPADMTGPSGKLNKTATHGFGSAVSYGRRYLMLLIFNISTTEKDDDGNSAGGGFITEEQVEILSELIKETKADLTKFLKYIGANALYEIPVKKFNQARLALEAKRAKK